MTTFQAHGAIGMKPETRYLWATSPPAQAGQADAAERGQPVGALLFRAVFAEAEQVGQGWQLRRPGR